MIRSFLILAMLGIAEPALPCTVVGEIASANALVDTAEVIVWVRAEGLSPNPGRMDQFLTQSPTRVRFSVIEILKGKLPSATVEFDGRLVNRDDSNDRPVPYDFIRLGGRRGNCYALEYRVGADYLLMLHTSQADAPPRELTPYWSLLAPTNEQLFNGALDPWLVWVRKALAKA